ncbi:MAG: right-handed parallel beta-helix repeat-containing protein [Clostridiales bacterium]|nr:right-handed parallel beta-helix repeat-containing protein [Clostridiales bacterium]
MMKNVMAKMLAFILVLMLAAVLLAGCGGAGSSGSGGAAQDGGAAPGDSGDSGAATGGGAGTGDGGGSGAGSGNGAGGNAAADTSGFAGPRANVYDDPEGGVYVSPDGNDASATGSIDAPYKSINAALADAQPGDTIILRSGVYREGINVRVRIPNITIKSAKGEWAVIDLTSPGPGADEDSGVYFDVDSSGGRLQCVEVMGGFYAVCMETKWDWGDPADRAGASGIIIEDCVLHDSRYDTVKVKPKCNDVTIRHNEIYNSGTAFAGGPKNGEDNAEGIDNVCGDGMVVQNNYIHDICSNAVYAKGGATDVLIENNWIEDAYGAGIMVGFDTSPEYFDLAANPQYYENIRGVVRNNLIVNTGWEGIGLYGSRDAQVYNNTLVNVVNGGQYHSAVYFGLTYQDWESYAGRPANANPAIQNNIVCQPNGIVRPMVEIRYSDELGGMSALDGKPVMDGNCYFIAGKSALFSDRRPGSVLEDAGFSAWQSHIGGEGGSLEADPALDGGYMPTNPQCAGMGLAHALSRAAGQAG